MPNYQSPLLNQLANRLENQITQTQRQPYAVLILITNEKNPKVLYSLRTTTLNNHAGEVSFVGGRQEPTDSDNHATALRESYEETGILPSMVTVLGELPIQHTKKGLPVLPVVGIMPADLPLTPQPSEVERLFWAELGDLIQQPVVCFTKQYDNVVINSPAFIIDNETVWGLTGRITASLLEIGFDRKIDWQYHIRPDQV